MYNIDRRKEGTNSRSCKTFLRFPQEPEIHSHKNETFMYATNYLLLVQPAAALSVAILSVSCCC